MLEPVDSEKKKHYNFNVKLCNKIILLTIFFRVYTAFIRIDDVFRSKIHKIIIRHKILDIKKNVINKNREDTSL